MNVLTQAQMEQLVRFGDKATGWILISAGAFLVALTETWNLKAVSHWSLTVYVLVVVVALLACAAYTAVRLKRTNDIIRKPDGPAQPEL